MTQFQPLGQTPRWRILYGILQTCAVDEILTYERMADALELHPDRDRHALQMAMRRAAREFEELNKHAVEAVRNAGYRIVHAEEHVRLANGHQRRSRRSLTRGHSKVVNVDMRGMSREMRQLTEAKARVLSQEIDFLRRFDDKAQATDLLVRQVVTGGS